MKRSVLKVQRPHWRLSLLPPTFLRPPLATISTAIIISTTVTIRNQLVSVWICECMGVWVCGCVSVWVYGCVSVWVCECVSVWVYGCVSVWVCECMGVWVYGCVSVWVCECMDVWVYECVYGKCVNCVYIYCTVGKFWEVKFSCFFYGSDNQQEKIHKNWVPCMRTIITMCYLNPCVTQREFFSPRKLLNEAISIITQNFTP